MFTLGKGDILIFVNCRYFVGGKLLSRFFSRPTLILVNYYILYYCQFKITFLLNAFYCGCELYFVGVIIDLVDGIFTLCSTNISLL